VPVCGGYGSSMLVHAGCAFFVLTYRRLNMATKVNSWEEALDQLVEEKQVLRQVLHNIVMEWEVVGDDSCCFEKMGS